jgi:hypothetical protein
MWSGPHLNTTLCIFRTRSHSLWPSHSLAQAKNGDKQFWKLKLYAANDKAQDALSFCIFGWEAGIQGLFFLLFSMCSHHIHTRFPPGSQRAPQVPNLFPTAPQFLSHTKLHSHVQDIDLLEWNEKKYINFNIELLWIFGREFFKMNNHFLFNKPKMVVFHKCLKDFLDKILSMHVGNTILIDHNLVRMMRSPRDNVMLVQKWNCRVEVFSKYLMGGSPPLLAAISFHKRVCVYICGTQCFWYDMTDKY